MRYKIPKLKLPKFKLPRIGDYKVKEKFLFFPKIINGELRWLEIAKYEIRYSSGDLLNYWRGIRWLDD